VSSSSFFFYFFSLFCRACRCATFWLVGEGLGDLEKEGEIDVLGEKLFELDVEADCEELWLAEVDAEALPDTLCEALCEALTEAEVEAD